MMLEDVEVQDSEQTRRNYLKVMGASSAGLLAGCIGGDDGGSDEIEFMTWNLEFLEESIEGWMNDFEDEYDAEASWIDRADDNARQFITNRLQADDPIEAINTGGDYSSYALDGVYADFEEVAPDDVLSTLEDRMGQETLERARIDGTLYGVPWYASSDIMYYVTEYFDAMDFDLGASNDWTLNEFFDNMEATVEETEAEYGFTFKWYTEVFPVMLKAWEPSIDFLNEDETEAAFNTDETVELVSRLQELTQDGIIPEASFSQEASEPQSREFANGNTAAYLASNSILREFEGQAGWVDEETVGSSPWPNNTTAFNAMYWSVSANADSESQEMAARLIDVITNDKWSVDFLEETTVMVTNQAANEEIASDEEFVSENPILAEGYDIFNTVTEEGRLYTVPMHENGLQIQEEVLSIITEVILDDGDIEDALDRAEDRVNELLNE